MLIHAHRLSYYLTSRISDANNVLAYKLNIDLNARLATIMQILQFSGKLNITTLNTQSVKGMYSTNTVATV